MRQAKALLLIAALVSLAGCAALCGSEPPARDLFDRTTWHRDRERLRWESCMGYLPDPAVPVRIVR